MEVPTPPGPHRAVSGGTGRYDRDKRNAIAWLGTTLGAVAIGAAGFAHGKLWSHETDIAVLKNENTAIKDSLKEQKDLLREILTSLRRAP